MHFQHHSKPNVIDKDPDTRIEPLFLLGDTIPIRVSFQLFFFVHISFLFDRKLKKMPNTERKCHIISNIYTFLSVIKRFEIEINKNIWFVGISSGPTSLSCVFSIHDHTTCNQSTTMAGLFDLILKRKRILFFSIVGSRMFNVILYQIHTAHVYQTWCTRNIEILFYATVISIRNCFLN